MNSFSNFKKVLWIVQSCIVLVIIVEAFLFCLKWRYFCESSFRENEGV